MMAAVQALSEQNAQEKVAETPVEEALSRLELTPAQTEDACAYCSLHEPASLVKCLTCKRWFCNGGGGASASHAVSHLVTARHREVTLHPGGALGETVLECYKCGCRNLFSLGFVAAKEDAVVVLLCRQPCAAQPAKDNAWDVREWQPLIEERAIVPWLVRVPDPETAALQAQRVSLAQMKALETLWKENAEASLADVEHELEEAALEPVLTSYDDAQHYQRVFVPLVHAEGDASRHVKQGQTQERVHVAWETGLNGRLVAKFALDKFDHGEIKLNVGDELSLKLPGDFLRDAWDGVGVVVRLPARQSHEIAVELKVAHGEPKPPSDVTRGFSVTSLWNGIPYERMLKAIKRFSKDQESLSGYIYHRLLGHEIGPKVLNAPVPASLHAPGLPELNHSQAYAVQGVLQRPLSLIQGPPGTGKTVTSATLVYHLVQSHPNSKVLVCAPSNVAVDHLTEKISRTGLKVVRVPARSREALSSDISYLSLTEQVRAYAEKAHAEYLTLLKLRDKLGELKPSDERRAKVLRRKLEGKILSAAQVVCCTCVTAGSSMLASMRFSALLIDEATQATEPECLIPFVTGIKQAVIVGDHQQLGPIVMSKAAAAAGLGQSLFERLIVLGIRPYRLQVQYRMHPTLSEFPSNVFYEGSLQNGVAAEDRRRADVQFPFPEPDAPYMFYCSYGPEELGSTGTSYLNRSEAAAVERMVTMFLKSGVDPAQIGIITPYGEQRLYLTNYMLTNGVLDQALYARIEVESVDAFQGREKDYVILSCVRSNEQQGIGFLSDPRRLNVAITRAKYGLVIVGNPKVLCKHSLWYMLIEDARAKGVLVEGPLELLRPMTDEITRPQRHRENNSFSRKLEVEKRDAVAHLRARAHRRPVVGTSTMDNAVDPYDRSYLDHLNQYARPGGAAFGDALPDLSSDLARSLAATDYAALGRLDSAGGAAVAAASQYDRMAGGDPEAIAAARPAEFYKHRSTLDYVLGHPPLGFSDDGYSLPGARHVTQFDAFRP